jgi:amino acid transporter
MELIFCLTLCGAPSSESLLSIAVVGDKSNVEVGSSLRRFQVVVFFFFFLHLRVIGLSSLLSFFQVRQVMSDEKAGLLAGRDGDGADPPARTSLNNDTNSNPSFTQRNRQSSVASPSTEGQGLTNQAGVRNNSIAGRARSDSVPLEIRVIASQEFAKNGPQLTSHESGLTRQPTTLSYDSHAASALSMEEKQPGCKNSWEEAPAGKITIYDHRDVPPGTESTPGVPQHLLGQWLATSIAGNDITSSCLYSSGVVATASGIMSPFAVTLVAFVLYLFRSIYTEACTALPMNGGSYNILLNTTSKLLAALAAVLSLLSYTATAVVSADSAAHYLNYGYDKIPVELTCICVLVVFAFLLLLGVKDSARTAIVIFTIHMITMVILMVAAFVWACQDGFLQLRTNWYSPLKEANPHGNMAVNLFYGYCMGLLGITGFESSANYIEEQKPGVFAKTLRNMWAATSFLNPVLAVLCLAGLPIDILVNQSTYSLAILGDYVAGKWLKYLVVVDATMVLCGGVLASYVGVTGLMRRLALDNILPKIFLVTNSCRHTNHFIIFFFCLVTSSLRLLVTDINTLSGVYSIAFLGVMSLFCIGALVLKAKRGELKREVVTPVPQCILGLCLLLAGIVGQILLGSAAEWFLLYFIIFAFIVVCTMLRVTLLRGLVRLTARRLPRVSWWFRKQVQDAREQPMVFFVKSQPLSKLNKVILYVMENENTQRLQFCHFSNVDEDPYIDYLKECCAILDRIYPKITVEMVLVRGQEFCPNSVKELSEQLNVPRHFMFVGCPDNKFPHSFGDFGGVRVITH